MRGTGSPWPTHPGPGHPGHPGGPTAPPKVAGPVRRFRKRKN